MIPTNVSVEERGMLNIRDGPTKNENTEEKKILARIKPRLSVF